MPVLSRSLLTGCLVAGLGAVADNTFFAVLQDPKTGIASVGLFNATTGNETASASTSWQFRFPLVESTADVTTKQIYTITYPNGDPATLYQFDAASAPPTLSQSAVSATANSSYFDLQYSENQQTFFGIYVSSAYGRVLSQFPSLGQSNGGNEVQHIPIQELPYMWYVNASTFDPTTDTYYGLLNHFPGTENATDAQKLAIGSFASSPGSATFVDLVAAPGSPSGIIHFIAYSQPTSTLYGFAQMDPQTAHFVTIEPKTGVYQSFFDVAPVVVAPMYASKDEALLMAWGNNADDGTRLFGTLDLKAAQNSTDDDVAAFQIVQIYSDTKVVASVARVDW
jgi:hypothetical protein